MIRIINTQGFTGWFLRLRDVSSLPSVSVNLTAGLRRESVKVLVTPSCPTLWDWSSPGSSLHGIEPGSPALQADSSLSELPGKHPMNRTHAILIGCWELDQDWVWNQTPDRWYYLKWKLTAKIRKLPVTIGNQTVWEPSTGVAVGQWYIR